MTRELERLVRRLERERAARKQAEQLFELRSQELWEANLKLKGLADSLMQSEQRLRIMADHAPVCIAQIDRHLRYVYANDRYCALYGLAAGDLVGQHVRDIIGPVYYAEKSPYLLRALNGETIEFELSKTPAAGVTRHYSVACQPEFDGQGEVLGLLIALTDVTERILIEQQLQELNEYLETLVDERTLQVKTQNQIVRQQQQELLLAQSVFDKSAEAIVVTDPNGDIILINPAFTTITGYTAEEALSRNMRLLHSEVQTQGFYQDFWASLRADGRWQGEIWNRRKNGEIYPEWLSISSVADEDGKLLRYVGLFSDISKLKRAQEQVEFLAYHDPLTGLPNRLLGRERLQQALHLAHEHRRKLAVFCLDLDNFKLINDSHGHSVGDKVLKAVTSRLASCLAEADTLCRQAGDEFLIVRPEAEDQNELTEFGDRLLSVMAEPIMLELGPMEAGISVGIAVYPDDGRDAEALIRNADTALYAAKGGGRRHYRFFNPQMNADLLHYLEVRDALRLALERQEFVLYYQPKLDLRTLRIRGVEALIRWNHRKLGLTAPDHFLPVAEESGLITEIGDWVLHEACRQAADWLGKGLDFGSIAVNVSALQFKRGDFLETILDHLDRAGLMPSRLELELTESLLLDDSPIILDTIARLRTAGVSVSLDDFGTGYSSISYLKRFRLDKLKIDRSFVQDLDRNELNQSLIRSIIQIGDNLDLTIIAEGVETEAEFAILRDMGCEEIQGYLISRPIPAEEFADFHAERFATRMGAPDPALAALADPGRQTRQDDRASTMCPPESP